MPDTLKLLCIVPHPDDESMGFGGTLAKYAAEGVETYLICATKGERGWLGKPDEYPGMEALGQLREEELRASVQVLGIRELHFLDYIDGDLDQAEPTAAIAKLVAHIRTIRPQVVLTFGPDGLYGHPDHIAISQWTTAAVVRAADASHADSQLPHNVSKLYYLAYTQETVDLFYAAYGQFSMPVDGVERRLVAWPDWAFTTQIHAQEYGELAWQAVACHRSQLPNYERMAALPSDHHRRLWGRQNYYRAYSLVNGGRTVETDLFEGLR